MDEKRKELIVYVWQKDDKRYTTFSNAYARTASKGDRKSVPVASDYAKMFQACVSYNQQIKNRMWPHRHGGKGHLGERGKHSSFAFACVLLNTFNAYRDIMKVDKSDFEYYGFCKTLASGLYEYICTHTVYCNYCLASYIVSTA